MKNFIKKLVCFRGIIFDNKAFYVNAVVFLSFLAFSFLSFSILSPIISSDAATNTVTDGNSVYSASFSIDDATPISVTPTALQTVYTGASTMSYTNTCPYGMSVTLSSSSSDTNLTRNGTDSGTKTIPTISSGTSLSDYTWGYSLDDGATYNGIPGLSSPAIILSTSSANATAATKDIVYGIKTDDQLPSGSYSSIIVYTLSVSPQCIAYNLSWDLNGGTGATGVDYGNQSITYGDTINLQNYTPTKTDYVFGGWSNGTTTFDPESGAVDVNPSNIPTVTLTAQWLEIEPMQDFVCSSRLNIGDMAAVRDTRDGTVYTVKKLKDGNCWMRENLKISNKTISSSDSNLASGTSFTIPVSNLSDFSYSSTPDPDPDLPSVPVDTYAVSAVYVDSTYGGYYNFYTATAGTGGSSMTSGNATYDICPKGWRLPDDSEYDTLRYHYNSGSLMKGEPKFNLPGQIQDASFVNKDSYGYYWSSTVMHNTFARGSGLDDSNVSNVSSDKRAGFSVRCLAEPIPTMQTFKSSMLKNAGDSMQLEDVRDGNVYTVKKLADGNVWMLENLRLIDKSISSEDSNLPSGETYTVLASNISSFTTSYNTNSAYLDSTYGGYYNFYTATAGWGTKSVTSGNSPKDICPKGWRLPTSGSFGEFSTLYEQYNSVASMIDALNFAFSGSVGNGSVSNQGTNGRLWSSTVSSANDAYNFVINSSKVYTGSPNNKTGGFSVRCIAKPTMQTFKSSMLKNAGDSMQLEDVRDGNVYTVKKLADGNVWMLENLRLIDKSISSEDSNLPSGETYTVPASDLSSFTDSINTNSAYLDSTYGGYYNFHTATAGWGTDSVPVGNSYKDICPKGWRLPTGGASGEFRALYNNYNSSALMQGEPNFTLSGYVNNGYVSYKGSNGYFRSSTVSNATAAYGLSIGSNVNDVSSTNKRYGYPVRCVAEDRTISDITYMQDMKPEIAENTPVDTTATLKDYRSSDNNNYTVRKLKDGKVWMTENLRIAGKTITSADSNVTSDFTIPASSTSGFNAQDTNNAYVDSTYGGYYTFYTATAGTGGSSLATDGANAPSSICPKGWRLPTGGSSGEFQTLYNNYNSVALMQGDPGFVLPGIVYNGSMYGQGSNGNFWSSTVRNANNAYDLRLDSSDVSPAYHAGKDLGYSVRCVAISS